MLTYLILHYKNADVTEQCIESLLNTNLGDAQIVVVDNDSSNGSYETLVLKYQDDNHIHFIHNEKNLGYAAGNNVGFRYAKNELDSEWIVLLNNDVTIEQKDFQQKIYFEYEKYPFYVAGPDIQTPEGGNQNPFRMEPPEKKSVMKRLLHDYLVFALMKIGLQQKLKRLLHYDGSIFQQNDVETIRNFKGLLHGSCIIFSPDYVKRYDGLYNDTFLYCEEEILCYILQKTNAQYSYIKELKVTHRHSITMKREVLDENKRKMIEIKRRIQSYKKLLHIFNDRGDVSKYLKG